MSKYQEEMYKNKSYEDYDYAAFEGVPLIQGDVNCERNRTNPRQYPGNRRTPMSNVSGPAGSVLIRTAGNALQAVPLSLVENTPIQFVEVFVPSNAQPGDTLHVRSPYGSGEELIAAIIPEGLYPGQSFYVQIPAVVRDEEVALTESFPLAHLSEAPVATAPSDDVIVVAGEDVSPSDINHDLHLYPATAESNRHGEMA
jgi:hypothetical protein